MQRIKQLFDEKMSHAYFWMKVEISHLKKDRNGHYYIDLVETHNGKIIAKSEARLWNYTAEYLRGELGDRLDAILQTGQTILCYCKTEFHTIYGLSFVITQLDVSFHLGELERKKQATIDKLKRNQMLEANKKHTLPIVVQRIALIASPSSSGYHDFIQQLKTNEFGYTFKVDLFSTQVQGVYASDEIVSTIQKVKSKAYDAVVLLRGGGSKLDLEVFNVYEIAEAIALQGLPVLTGIGHETDQTVADLVAYQSLKTPTAIASFLIERMHTFHIKIEKAHTEILHLYQKNIKNECNVNQQQTLQLKQLSQAMLILQRQKQMEHAHQVVYYSKEALSIEERFLEKFKYELKNRVQKIHSDERKELHRSKGKIEFHSRLLFKEQQQETDHIKEQLSFLAAMVLKKERKQWERWNELIHLHSIEQTLEKGFALLKKNGKIVTPTTRLELGDSIEIETQHRTIQATIDSIPLWKELLTKVQQEN